MGTRQGEMFRASAITGIDSFSGNGGEGGTGGTPAVQQDGHGFNPIARSARVRLGNGKMTISPPARKVKELREQLEEWPAGRSTATVRENLVLAGKLHNAAYAITPGRYFVRRLLQVSNLDPVSYTHLTLPTILRV